MSLITSRGTKVGIVSDHTRLAESLLPVLIPGLALSFPHMLLATGGGLWSIICSLAQLWPNLGFLASDLDPFSLPPFPLCLMPCKRMLARVSSLLRVEKIRQCRCWFTEG